MERIFRPNRRFRRKYDRLFKQDPQAANLFLLLAELADENGRVEANPEELARLMAARPAIATCGKAFLTNCFAARSALLELIHQPRAK